MIEFNSEDIIVFDLDDTIYDEGTYIQSAYTAIAAYLSTHTNCSKEYVLNKLHNIREKDGDSNVLQGICEDLKLDFDIHKEEMIRIYQNVDADIVMFEDAKLLIESLSKNNNILAIITNGGVKTQSNKIRLLKKRHESLWSFSKTIITGEHFSKKDWKPSNLPFLKLKQHFKNNKLLKGKIYYIGNDASRDVKGALNEGFSVIIRPIKQRDFNSLQEIENKKYNFFIIHSLVETIKGVAK